MNYNPFKSIPQESANIPYYVTYDILKMGKDEIILWNPDEGYSNISEVFCVNEGRVYFLNDIRDDSTYFRNWSIVSFDIKTKEYQTHCTLNNVEEWYYKKNQKEYERLDGYCKDGKIILNDKKTVLVFDMDTQEVQKYPYEEYSFPKREIYGEWCGSYTIRTIVNGEVRIWSLQDIAEKSESIAELYTYKSKLNWNKKSYLEGFGYECSTQCIEDKIYFIANCMNYEGSAIVVILEYDTTNDTWNYVTSDNCGGDWPDAHVIPCYD